MLDRFSQIDPTVSIAADGYRYGGKQFTVADTVQQLHAALPSLAGAVRVPGLGTLTPAGMISWDQRRRRRHQPPPRIHRRHRLHRQPPPTRTEPPAAISSSVGQLWQDHIDDQTQERARAVARQTAVDQVIEILQEAELRHDLAPAILAETADDPAQVTDHVRAQVAERLRRFAAEAVDRTAQSASDAARTVIDVQQHAAREGVTAQSREDLADLFAAATLAGQAPTTPDDIASRWLDALETLLRASIAAH